MEGKKAWENPHPFFARDLTIDSKSKHHAQNLGYVYPLFFVALILVKKVQLNQIKMKVKKKRSWADCVLSILYFTKFWYLCNPGSFLL